jgi:hypothetical protein
MESGGHHEEKEKSESESKEEREKSGIKVTDSFAFNAQFSCPSRKITIPMASLEESHNPKKIDEDRSVKIEAAIVRIMKVVHHCHHVIVCTYLALYDALRIFI